MDTLIQSNQVFILSFSNNEITILAFIQCPVSSQILEKSVNCSFKHLHCDA